MTTSKPSINIVVLISGSGSNLQALINGQEDGSLPINIIGVISNKAGVKGIERAQQHHIPCHVINHKDFDSREAFDQALQAKIDSYHPELIVLAGFMRILTPAFTQHFSGRMLNIHPSLLPKYQGLHTHKRAIEAGDQHHGVTVHFVTAELDGGPNIIQAKVAINADDTETTLAQKVQQQEHVIYPLAVKWFAQSELILKDNTVYLKGEALAPQGYQLEHIIN